MLLGSGALVYWLIAHLPEPPRGGWVEYYFGDSIIVILLAFALMVVVVLSAISAGLIGGLGVVGLIIFEFRARSRKAANDGAPQN